MLKKASYFFMFLAVLITVSHSVFAHHHDIESVFHHNLTDDDHDNDHHGHNVFSIVQMDEKYVSSSSQHHWDSHIVLLFIQALPYMHIVTESSSKQAVVFHEDYPPPKSFIKKSFSHRGPPLA